MGERVFKKDVIARALKPWPLWVKFCLLFIPKQRADDMGWFINYKTFRGKTYVISSAVNPQKQFAAGCMSDKCQLSQNMEIKMDEKVVAVETLESGRDALKLAAVLAKIPMKELSTKLFKEELMRLQNKPD